MIGTIVRLGFINLKRDRGALFLTFVVPLVFFSIFAMIFGNLGGGGGDDGGPKALGVLAVDEDGTAISASFLAALAQQDGLEVALAPEAAEGAEEGGERWTRETAFREVRRGNAAAAVVVSRGFGADFGAFGQGGAAVELIYDASNPFAQYTVNGLLQAAAFQSSPGVLMERGLETLEDFGGGGVTDEQRTAIANVQGLLSIASAQGSGAGTVGGLIAVGATAAHDETVEGEEEKPPSMVAYYAAGIGVMFLLFSSVGAAGTLLEDLESGTLERLLSSRIGMSELLRGRWLFYSALGLSQVALMFLWGSVAFGLDLFSAKRLVGFGLMAVVTAAAAAAFALMLAAACKSRAQLGGVSTIVILVMSALGGSMVPRFVMPDFMDTLALFTFNGWALDGFLKVFWYDDPTAGVVGGALDLLPQLAVLATLTVVFLWLARRLAGRWEAA